MNEERKIAFLFPGQGAQYPGMGKDFFEQFSEARLVYEEADDLLNRKLSTVVFDGPEDVLVQTRNSQLGIYATSFAILRVIEKLYPEIRPTVCSGLSLGEYTAATAASYFDFSTGLSLVKYRSQFMNDACETTQGTMAVIMGLDAEVVSSLVEQLNIPSDLWVANFNCPGQVVISGTIPGVTAGSAEAKAKGAKRVIPLPVHGAFHSGLMRKAELQLADYVNQAQMKKGFADFVMNVPGNYVSNVDEVRENLIKQVTHPVKWEQGIRAMNARGIQLYIEIGCGKTLSGMNKRIGVVGETISIEKVSDLDSFEKQIRGAKE